MKQIRELNEERQKRVLEHLIKLKEQGTSPKLRASEVTSGKLEIGEHSGFKFFYSEIDGFAFRCEIGITSNPKPTLVILRIAFRTCELNNHERVSLSSDGAFFRKVKKPQGDLWFEED